MENIREISRVYAHDAQVGTRDVMARTIVQRKLEGGAEAMMGQSTIIAFWNGPDFPGGER